MAASHTLCDLPCLKQYLHREPPASLFPDKKLALGDQLLREAGQKLPLATYGRLRSTYFPRGNCRAGDPLASRQIKENAVEGENRFGRARLFALPNLWMAMLKDRHEFTTLGELALFVLAWGISGWAIVDHYRLHTGLLPGDSVASTTIEPADRDFGRDYK